MENLAQKVKALKQSNQYSLKAGRKACRNVMKTATTLQYGKYANARLTKDLTTYANECMESKLKPLVDLLFDFTQNRTEITQIKHSVIMYCKRRKCGRFHYIMEEVLKQQITLRISSGKIRKSDLTILNKKY